MHVSSYMRVCTVIIKNNGYIYGTQYRCTHYEKKLLISALFYFIGHGYERSGQCYLVPRHDLKDHRTVCANHIIQRIQNYGTALTLIVLDICQKP